MRKITGLRCQLYPVENRWINFWADRADFFGGMRATGTIVGFMLLREEPVSIEDLHEATHLSISSVRSAIIEGIHMGLIRKSDLRIHGSKKQTFELFNNEENGWSWMNWRLGRLHVMVHEPTVEVLKDVLAHKELFSQSVVKRLNEITENFQCTNDLIRSLKFLGPDKVREWCIQATALAKNLAEATASHSTECSF